MRVRHGNAKVGYDEVVALRLAYRDGASFRDLARMCPLDVSTLRALVLGWTHKAVPYAQPLRRKAKSETAVRELLRQVQRDARP